MKYSTFQNYILLFAICLVSTTQALAQSNKIDSINHLIATAKTDTGRINLYTKKVSLLARSNPDTAIMLGLQTIQEAQRLHFYKGEADVRERIVDAYESKGDFEKAKEQLVYLETFITATDTLSRVDMLAGFAKYYGVQSKYDSSILYSKQGIPLAEKSKYLSKLSTLYSYVGIGYEQLGNFSSSLVYQQKSLELAEQQSNEVAQAYTLVNMGMTYEDIKDSVKAEQTYIRAADLAKKNQLAVVEMNAYSNLATLYVNSKNYSKGYDVALKGAKLAQLNHDQSISAACYSKASAALSSLGRFSEAYPLAQLSLKIADSCKEPLAIAGAANAMGDYFYFQKKYTDALPFLEKHFQIMQDASNYSDASVNAYKELSDCYEKTGNYQKALDVFKIAVKIADSVRSLDNIRKTTELSMTYQFEKKQQVQQAIKEQQDKNNQIKQIFLIAFLLVFVTLSIVSLVAYRNKKKANALLSDQKVEVESTLDRLKTTQAQLIQSEKMASLGELTAGIAHEIQNPLNFVNNFSEVNKELLLEMREEIENSNYDEVKDIMEDVIGNEEKIAFHGKRADAIVKGMLQHSRKNNGQTEPADINALCDEYLRLSYHGLRAKDKSFNANFTTDFDAAAGIINIVPQDIGRVLLNLFNNSFYAVNEKKKKVPNNSFQPTVSIKTRRLNNKIEIVVSDYGDGIPQPIIDKIFQPFFTTKPTGQGTGLGLSMSYDIITKEHNGTIKAESKEGEGTTFTIQLPV